MRPDSGYPLRSRAQLEKASGSFRISRSSERVLLLQLDGSLPNLALMRIAQYHRTQGDAVELRRVGNPSALQPELWGEPRRVYASLIFERSRPLAEHVLTVYPLAIIGGTGWDLSTTLESEGIWETRPDYSIYPAFEPSLGFTQRGCRLKCPFCVVPRKEGKAHVEARVYDIWRGPGHPRDLILLDNDFFGQQTWRRRIDELVDGNFRVNFNQGINARLLTDEAAAALARTRYYDVRFKRRCLYTAWDNRKDEKRLFDGLELLVLHGVQPWHIMVYMLIGYWPGETVEDWNYRRSRLRDFGVDPYPMPYVRNKLTVGFQRWVAGAYDKRFPWEDWEAAGYRPEGLGVTAG